MLRKTKNQSPGVHLFAPTTFCHLGLCSSTYTSVGDKHLFVWEFNTFRRGRQTPSCVGDELISVWETNMSHVLLDFTWHAVLYIA